MNPFNIFNRKPKVIVIPAPVRKTGLVGTVRYKSTNRPTSKDSLHVRLAEENLEVRARQAGAV